MPADFVASAGENGATDWILPPDKLPEGAEDVVITMIPGPVPSFQWMVDPISGPPIDGTAKTAAEAFLAIRSALTQSGSSQNDLTNPLPKATKPKPKPVMAPPPVGSPPGTPPALVKSLELITKGLVQAGVFIDTTTAQDLRDILPPDIVNELSGINKSALSAATQEAHMSVEDLVESLPEEVVDYIGELEAQVTELTKRLTVTTDPEVDPITKALADLPPEAAKFFKAQAEQLAQAQQALEGERIAKANSVWIQKARSLDGIIDSPEDFGAALREIAESNPALAEKLDATLQAASARVNKAALFSEYGHTATRTGSAQDRVQTIAKGLVASEPGLSLVDAEVRAWEQNPDLYEEHRSEMRQRSKEA